jgi:hypothetical protein
MQHSGLGVRTPPQGMPVRVRRRRTRRPSEPAAQAGRDRTVLRQMPGCCIHSRCIRVQHDAARATKKRSDEGRCHQRPVVTLTYSAWLVNRSLPVSMLAWICETSRSLPATPIHGPRRVTTGHARTLTATRTTSWPPTWPPAPDPSARRDAGRGLQLNDCREVRNSSLAVRRAYRDQPNTRAHRRLGQPVQRRMAAIPRPLGAFLRHATPGFVTMPMCYDWSHP